MQRKTKLDYHKLKSGIIELVDIKNKNTMTFFLGFLIAVAYSAALGGLVTLVGTGPNIFVKGFMDQ